MDKLNINVNYKTPSKLDKLPEQVDELREILKQLIYDLQRDYNKNSERVNWLLTLVEDGVSGTFTTVDGKTITVTSGIVTGIV